MSPAPQVILLDSCAYFRLGQSIRPLLKGTFGPSPPYSLYVLAALDQEYLTSSRLRSKFEWVHEAQYVQDRADKLYTCRGKSAKDAETVFSYLAGYAKANKLKLAPEDIRAMAVAHVREFILVSDDKGVQQTSSEHGIDCWSSLKLLKVMLDHNRIPREKLIEIVELWQYQNDLPCTKDVFKLEFEDIFGITCPI